MKAGDSPSSALSLRSADAVNRDGFVAPVPLFSRAECDFIRRHLQFGEPPEPLLWDTGRFATDRLLYDLAIRPALLSLLRRLLGEDILLWGVNVLVRNPGEEHPSHTDIESSAPNDRFVSVWVGIQNSSRVSTLKLISNSHLFGKSLQEVASQRGFRRGEASDDVVLDWAREFDSNSALVQPEIHDGECIVFDGRLWHGSAHRGEGQRIALLFQYTTADTGVAIPDLSQLEWPFRHKAERAPTILVSGSMRAEHSVSAPPETENNAISNEVHSIRLPLPEDEVVG
jgi:Phytanoyl-CoA dioxygenase (PhyH)